MTLIMLVKIGVITGLFRAKIMSVHRGRELKKMRSLAELKEGGH